MFSTQPAQDVIRARTAWRCVSSQVQTVPVTGVCDDTAAGGQAYGVSFARDDVPGAGIAVWFYAATGYPFLVRYRYDRWATGQQWTGCGWGSYCWCENLLEAETGAQRLARSYLVNPWLTLTTELAGLFCWRGMR